MDRCSSFLVVYALEYSFLDLRGSGTPRCGGFHVFMLFIFALLSCWCFFSHGKAIPHARMYFLMWECISSHRDANPYVVCSKSSCGAMHFLMHSFTNSHMKPETSTLPRARNRGYLGLLEESLKVGFRHPFGFYTFLAQNRFPKGFRVYLSSKSWRIFNSLYLRYILIYATNHLIWVSDLYELR